MKKKALALFLGVMLLVTGCGGQEDNSQAPDNTTDTGNAQGSISDEGDTQAVFDGIIEIGNRDMFTNRDYQVEYDASKATLVQLEGDSVTCSAGSVQISGSIITLKEEGTYVFRGNLDNGMIIVDADDTDKVQLVLDNASIHSETSAPIYVMQADKVFVTLQKDTTNALSNGGSFEVLDENNINAVIFSKADLTLNGLGSLQVTSPGGHGISSKDDLVITSGAYTIDCASHGLDANDSVRLINAAFSIHSGKDGIHAENNDDAEQGYVYIESGDYKINAAGDGISAGAYMQVENGNFDIIAGGGSKNATKEHSDDWGMFGGGMGGRGHGMGAGQGTKPGQGMNPEEGMSLAPDMNPGEAIPQAPDMNSGEVMPQAPDMNPGEVMPQAPDMNLEQGLNPGIQNFVTGEQEDDGTSMKGMKAAGDLTIQNGSFVINSADDAVHSNASVTINGGTLDIIAGDDAFHADETLTIADGVINVMESYEGLEGLHIAVEGGDIKLVASDDGLNAAGGNDQSGMSGPRGNDKFGGSFSASSKGSVQISGGKMYINASGDGIDANGSLEIAGGETTICGPTRGDTAVLDYDSSAVITGGTFIGTGATQMAQTFRDSKQGVIAVNAGNQAAGSQVILTDKNGTIVMTYEPALDFSLLILSSPDIVTGETYTITIGDVSGEFEAD